MTSVFLKFRTDSGDERRAKVGGEFFIVGRHSESDLCIPDGRLSRRHLRIERYEDVYLASDAGSSNGTTLNGDPLMSPTALKNGDVLGLGGFEFAVVFENSAPVPQAVEHELFEAPSAAVPVATPADPPLPEIPSNVVVAESQPEAASNSSSMMLLLLIPVFGLILLLFTGGVLYLLLSEPTTTNAKKQDDSGDLYGDSDDPDTENKSSKNSDNGNKSSGTTTSTGSNNSSDTPTGSNSANTAKLGETAKIEQSGGAFLRQIAQNDPRAFLTSEQAQRLSPKVKQLGGTSAVAENLKNAQKNAGALKSLAASKNLKPQFLAVAAVAKLGGSRGDVLQTAQGMTEVLGKLSTHLGNELADDTLLVIAAYGQGTAGEFMKMRNMLQDLANKSPESSRSIRTIWFLQKNGKISQAEFENALNFLAIGTIAQNPKEFGVNAEALSL